VIRFAIYKHETRWLGFNIGTWGLCLR